ncbi:MAG TPA: M20 family peptidase [Candidatus Acetothermia bacterium]|nr:M20 family peptidase [Candidatus Acetothermia bacterium]
MTMDLSQVKTEVWKRIDEIADEIWDIALKIHENPELGFEEHKAAAWLTAALEKGGFQVERGVGGMETAFVAVHPTQAEGPAVAFLAEYDALPELGHACGHNIIAAIALGAGLGLAPFKETLPGKLMVIGTPAEEGGGGKIKLIDAGIFSDVDVAMMVHPADRTLVERGSLSITEVKIEFHGKPAHASGSPEEGINALDAVIQTFVGLNALRQHIRDGARIHGIITHGGTKPNIVPEYAAALFYVRDIDDDYKEELVEKLRKCAEGAALATGAKLTFTRVGHEYKSMRPNHHLAQSFRKNIEELGFEIDPPKGGMGSTDMGDVSQVVPAIHPYIKIAPTGTPGHSHEFAQAARSEEARKGMIAAAKALAAVALELWLVPGFYEEVRREFEEVVLKKGGRESP